MVCGACGAPGPEGAPFCHRCGVKQAPVPAPVPAPATTYPAAAPVAPGVAAAAARPADPGSDRLRGWWLAAGAFLFVALFVPVGWGGSVIMFWDLFDFNGSQAAWLIVNAVFGIAVFVSTLVVARGVVRGSILAGCGFAATILTLALLMGGVSGVFYGLGRIALAGVLAACLLRRDRVADLTPRLLGGIAGGLGAVFLLVATILMLVRTERGWVPIVSNAMEGLITLLGVVAGILCLTQIGSTRPSPAVLGASLKLVVFCFLGLAAWTFLGSLMAGLGYSAPAEALVLGSLHALVVGAAMFAHAMMLGLGLVELLRGIAAPAPAGAGG